MGRLTEILKASHSKKANAPGKAIILMTDASGVTRTTELYHPPGFQGAPTKGDVAAEISLTPSGRVAVATHNYRIEIPLTPGERAIYSTNASGDTVMAQIDLDTDGNIDLNGNTKTFVTHAELDTALQTFITALNSHTHPTAAVGAPSPPSAPMSLDISAAETTTVRTGG